MVWSGVGLDGWTGSTDGASGFSRWWWLLGPPERIACLPLVVLLLQVQVQVQVQLRVRQAQAHTLSGLSNQPPNFSPSSSCKVADNEQPAVYRGRRLFTRRPRRSPRRTSTSPSRSPRRTGRPLRFPPPLIRGSQRPRRGTSTIPTTSTATTTRLDPRSQTVSIPSTTSPRATA